MPEGAEILLTSQFLNTKLKNKYITKMKILSGRYTHQTLVGKSLMKNKLKIIKVDSKGKFMWIELKDENNKNIYIMNTFGMSGKWILNDESNNRIKFTINNKVNLYLVDLYFNDIRNFGTIKITRDKKELDKKLDNLGIDLIKSNMTLDKMIKHIIEFIEKKNESKRKTNNNIVKVLMTQDTKGIGSGIGNYLCAEILYRAKISPHRDITSLTDNEIKNLAKSIREILKRAYVNNQTPYLAHLATFIKSHHSNIKKEKYKDYFPDIKLNKKNGLNFNFKVYNQKVDPFGNKVTKSNIYNDRITWYVPKIQK